MKWINARNIENFIHYYRLDLIEIKRTGKTPQKWTTSEKKNIIKYGIIAKRSKAPGAPWILTPMVLNILEKIEALPNGDEGG